MASTPPNSGSVAAPDLCSYRRRSLARLGRLRAPVEDCDDIPDPYHSALDDRIEHPMQHGIPDDLFVNTGRRLNFTEIPVELRVRIYDLVLYHHPNEGYIAPMGRLADDDDAFRARVRGFEVVCRKSTSPPSRRCCLLRRAPQRYFALPVFAPAYGDPLGEILAIDDRIDMCPDLPSHLGAHLCSVACLRQPAITRVSRQIRQESLPVFYGINTFDFEMGSAITNGVAIARKWSRIIGDHNLSLIKRFSLGSRKCSREVESPHKKTRPNSRYTFRFGGNASVRTTLSLTIKEDSTYTLVTKSLEDWIAEPPRNCETGRWDKLMGYAGYVEAERLSAGMMEKILAILERKHVPGIDTEGDREREAEEKEMAIALQRSQHLYQFW